MLKTRNQCLGDKNLNNTSPKISYIYHMRLVLFTLALLTCFLAVVAKPYSPITVP